MQDAFQRHETVASRAHPETDALGVHAGSWFIYPRLGVDETYNDNIFATHSGAISDYVTTVSPDIYARSNWNNGLVTLDANDSKGWYATHGREDYNDYSFSGSGRYDISRFEYLAAQAGYYELHVPRTSPLNNFGTEPTTYNENTGTLEYYNKFGRFSVTGDGTLTSLMYSNVGNGGSGFIFNSDQNRNVYDGAVRVGYEIQPLMEAFVRAEGDSRDYEHKVANDGHRHSSTGYAVTTGLALDLGGLTFGQVGIGYMQRNYDDVAFGSVDGVTLNGQLTWNATTLDTVNFTVQRTIQESIVVGSPGFFSTTANLTEDHELLRDLILHASLGYENDSYIKISETNNIYGGGLGATYLINRYADAGLNYSYRQQTSNQESTLGYSQNLILLHLTVKM